MKSKYLFLSLASTLLLSACTSSGGVSNPADAGTGEVYTFEAPAQSLGSDSAPVTITTFSDLQCPACKAIEPQIRDVQESNPDDVRLEYRHFPLSQHRFAMDAAIGSECAADQGQFWEYVDYIFENQSTLSRELANETAPEELGLDLAAFEACLDDDAKRDLVLSHIREGSAAGVNSTPTLYVNGQKLQFPGRQALEDYVKSLVE